MSRPECESITDAEQQRWGSGIDIGVIPTIDAACGFDGNECPVGPGLDLSGAHADWTPARDVHR